MNLIPKALMLAAAMLAASHLQASERQSMAELAGLLPDTGEIHLGLFKDGEPDGFMRLGWQRDGEAMRVYDRTMMPSVEVYETLEIEVAADDLTPRTVAIRFHQGTAILNIDATHTLGQITGQRRVERPGVDDQITPIAVDAPDGVMFRALTFILPLILEQVEGTTLSYDWYAPLGNAVQSVTLTAFDGGSVETPAGTFDTLRYELRGGIPENDIYVSRGEKPRIVRIDVAGQPLQFLAVK